jgi:hypothetical protein
LRNRPTHRVSHVRSVISRSGTSHCKRCRKATGTGHATNLFVEGTLTFERGESQIARFKVPEAERFTNTFCTKCGARLPRFNESAGTVFIPAGSLDDDPGLSPQARIFMDSKADWSCSTEALPEYATYPK